MLNHPHACRACGGRNLETVLDLGLMPLANSLIASEDDLNAETRVPLVFVSCPVCGLAQITETVPPEKMFSDYSYFSSYSETMLQHARDVVSRLTLNRKLNRDSLVIEIASNDGYLLQYFVSKNIPVLGIEPAENVASVAIEQRKIPTIVEFFGTALAQRLQYEGRQADVIIANNVFAHVPDINGFLRGIRLVLKPSGVAVIEVPYLVNLLEKCQFDTIYHEHLCYFSVTAVDALLKANGLRLIDVEHVSVHGGSIRIFAGRDDVPASGMNIAGSNVQIFLSKEKESLYSEDRKFFREFSRRAEMIKNKTIEWFSIQAGKSIAAYGAAAKGCIFLNFCGLTEKYVSFVVDKNPAKQNRRMPGTHQPVYDPTVLLERHPDFVLILPWNIAAEVVRQESIYHEKGGRFVVAIPDIRIW